jgi:hypothetical protein
MKKISKVLLIIAILGLGLNSCQKEKFDVPGEIPGMGNSAGKLEATKYDFHEDLVFSPINGVGEKNRKSASDDVVIEGVAQGSGMMVVVTFTIKNNNPTDWRTVFFRAGTVFEVNVQGYQNGILLAPVLICLSPGETRIVTLYLYCLNYGLSDSDNSVYYEILGVTESPLMMELVNALQGKMVNYEDYMIYYGVGAGAAYNVVKDKLQAIVWHITNGSGMTNADLEYVNSLPDLPQGVYPKGIYDLDFVLPASWCAGCRLETAWGGTSQGEVSGAWWFYYDTSVGGLQEIYAGQYIVAGAYVEYVNDEIRIVLGGKMSLIDDDEAVKIQGYNELPKKRPVAGQFTTYKGTNLIVPVDEYTYYAVHLEVAVCN